MGANRSKKKGIIFWIWQIYIQVLLQDNVIPLPPKSLCFVGLFCGWMPGCTFWLVQSVKFFYHLGFNFEGQIGATAWMEYSTGTQVWSCILILPWLMAIRWYQVMICLLCTSAFPASTVFAKCCGISHCAGLCRSSFTQLWELHAVVGAREGDFPQ